LQATQAIAEKKLSREYFYSHPDKIELKKISSPSENKKYTAAPTNTTKAMTVKLKNDNGLQRWTDRRPTGNSGLPQLAVTCKIEAKCYYQTFLLGNSEVLRNRQLRLSLSHQVHTEIMYP
jgi:hypothetical protein